MKLLILTQVVDEDDANLGFFHRWIEEFAKHCAKIIVIANKVGTHHFPPHVTVLSLGKEKGRLRIVRYILFYWDFFRAINEVDTIFFHMIAEFVVMTLPALWILRKKTALWYAHKSVTVSLKIAERVVNIIFTPSPLSFRLPSEKVIYTGHAIDTELFKPEINTPSILRLLTVGRISPVKDYETIIKACFLLRDWPRPWHLSIVGGGIMPEDEAYIMRLKTFVKENGLESHVTFWGSRPYREIPSIYAAHDIFLSTSGTGAIDKAMLEAMASGLLVIGTGEAFRDILPSEYFLEEKTPPRLAEKIKLVADREKPNHELRNLVVKNHALHNTIATIIATLSKI